MCSSHREIEELENILSIMFSIFLNQLMLFPSIFSIIKSKGDFSAAILASLTKKQGKEKLAPNSRLFGYEI